MHKYVMGRADVINHSCRCRGEWSVSRPGRPVTMWRWKRLLLPGVEYTSNQ